MKAAADADAHFVGQALPRRQDRSSRRQPEGLDQFRRKRNFQFHFLARAERAGLQLLHVLGLVYEQNVLIGGGLRLEKIRRLGDARGDQAIANAAIFFGGEDMRADREVVGVAVDELEGQHERALRSYRRLNSDTLDVILNGGEAAVRDRTSVTGCKDVERK